MEPTPLEPDTELDSARVIPLVALAWAALTAWAAWRSHLNGWQPYWLYPPLLVAMVAALALLSVLAVQGARQLRALRHATVILNQPFLTIGERARLAVQTGANQGSALTVDVHLEGREYTREFRAKNTASETGGGWKVDEHLVYRSYLCGATAPEGARLDDLNLVVPTDIHPSVLEKPHGIEWVLRIRIKAGTAPTWDAKYPVKVRGRNGSGVSLDSNHQEFQFPKISDDRLQKLQPGV